ncbi:MAG: PorP/SprF family type IX secretion system membrane protein [Saprospiraceae bacterium]|nr:PorP/SprF family type IX secretion system membrane protein [Saprospiraceae bacterium]
MALSQDANFVQFERAPLVLNPALAGSFEGTHRLQVHHRNQWESIYKTSLFSYDSKVEPSSSEIIGIGFSGKRDRAGASNFTIDKIQILASYNKRYNTDTDIYHSLGAGMSVGIANRHFDISDLRWPSQGSGRPFLVSSVHYFDMSGGLLWKTVWKDKTSLKIGVAVDHVNKPNVSFFENVERLHRRVVIHGSGELSLGSYISILPAFMYTKQGPHNLFLLGSSAKWYSQNESILQSVQFDIWMGNNKNLDGRQNTSSYVVSTAMQLDKLEVSFSYDFKTTIGFKAYEIGVGYFFG